MSTLSTLPWFIIVKIMKLTYPDTRLGNKLPLLGICHRWRSLGIPLIYDCAFLFVSGYSEEGSRNDEQLVGSFLKQCRGYLSPLSYEINIG